MHPVAPRQLWLTRHQNLEPGIAPAAPKNEKNSLKTH
jgi:hypothetical protein